jgi:hypothetical protein
MPKNGSQAVQSVIGRVSGSNETARVGKTTVGAGVQLASCFMQPSRVGPQAI